MKKAGVYFALIILVCAVYVLVSVHVVSAGDVPACYGKAIPNKCWLPSGGFAKVGDLQCDSRAKRLDTRDRCDLTTWNGETFYGWVPDYCNANLICNDVNCYSEINGNPVSYASCVPWLCYYGDSQHYGEGRDAECTTLFTGKNCMAKYCGISGSKKLPIWESLTCKDRKICKLTKYGAECALTTADIIPKVQEERRSALPEVRVWIA